MGFILGHEILYCYGCKYKLQMKKITRSFDSTFLFSLCQRRVVLFTLTGFHEFLVSLMNLIYDLNFESILI